MDYKKAYEEALERAREWYYKGNALIYADRCMCEVFPELAESDDEKIRKDIIRILKGELGYTSKADSDKYIAWLEKQKEPEDKGDISDGYHTFNELYRYRMLYNAAFFNLLPKEWVHKSTKHHDGEECFGGGWFIVMANLPTGQISNHYELKDWDLFHVPEKEVADEWDGHTPQEAAERLHKYLLEKQDQKAIKESLRAEYEKGRADAFAEIYQPAQSELTKTCKQNFNDKVVPRFKIGDWIINPINGIIRKILSIEGNFYVTDSGALSMEFYEEHFCLWTIQDAKDGDVLASGEIIFIFNKIYDVWVNCHCSLHKDKSFIGEDYNLMHIKYSKEIYPATKEQRDQLEKAMSDAGYRWNKEEKKLEKIEQKPAWSDEDSKMFNICCNYLDVEKCVWLKSLKDRLRGGK